MGIVVRIWSPLMAYKLLSSQLMGYRHAPRTALCSTALATVLVIAQLETACAMDAGMAMLLVERKTMLHVKTTEDLATPTMAHVSVQMRAPLDRSARSLSSATMVVIVIQSTALARVLAHVSRRIHLECATIFQPRSATDTHVEGMASVCAL